MNLTLTDKKVETPDVTTYIFKPEQPVTWQAGQFLKYTLPVDQPDDRGINRFFTIASAPHEHDIYITTRLTRERGSTFKQALDQLAIGDQIQATEPMGEFIFQDEQAGHVFIAGGIGITPFRAMLLDLAHRQRPINVNLLYANRDQDVVYRQELEQLTAKHPLFNIVYFFDPERIQLDDIQQAASQLGKPATYYYLSGPKPMVHSYEQQLRDADIPDQYIKTDYFPGYN